VKLFILLTATFFSLPLFAGNGPITTKNSQKQTVNQVFVHFNSLKTPTFEIFFENTGNIQDPSGNKSIVYPLGSGKSPLFASGFALSGYAGDTLRTSWMASASRIEDWQPGNIVNGVPADPANSRFKVYKYTLGEFLATNPEIKDWPADLGAPFKDENSNGIFEPEKGELPEIMGSQMIWYVINDGVPPGNRPFNGSRGLGIEAQISAFFFSGKSQPLDHTAFVVYKFIHKGNQPVKNMIFSLWSDPDLGDSEDDLVGIDSSRSLAYCYNEKASDNIYGAAVPAFGYDFFLGPKIYTGNPLDTLQVLGTTYIGYKALNMHSFVKYVRGRVDLPDPQTSEEARNYQEGKKFNGAFYDPLTEGVGGVPQDNPLVVHPGFPETNLGWRDKLGGDRRMMINTQPFDMAPGDTQIIVVGYVIGASATNLASISTLRYNSDEAQNAYTKLLQIEPEKPKTGFLSLKVTNKNSVPVRQAEIAIKKSGDPTYFGSLTDFSLQSYDAVLYEGVYDLRVVAYPDTWGRIPDTVYKVLSVFEDNTVNLDVKCTEIAGYRDKFSKIDTVNWIYGAKGDTVYTSIQAPPKWTVTSGFLGWSSNIPYKGSYSVTAKLNLAHYTSPVMKLKANYRLTGSGDSLQIMGSSDGGHTWVLIHSLQALTTTNQYVPLEFSLANLLSIEDSVWIKFRAVKSSGSPVQIRLDDFEVLPLEYTSVPEISGIQNQLFLHPAYPNPFNPATTLRWSQPVAGKAVIRILNLLGQDIQEIKTGDLPAGENHLAVSFSHQPSGIYFYRIEVAGRQSETGKLLLLK